jgi:hypothetical protein
VQNLNSINTRNLIYKSREILEDTQLMQANIQGVIEHNLDATNFEVRCLCHDNTKKAFHHHSIEFGSSTIPFKTQYKPGGTMAIAHGNIVGQITHKSSAPLGRCSTLTFACQNNQVLQFITAYQVCPRPNNRTGTTVFHQQESLLRLQGRTDLNPRRHFQIDILKYLKTLKDRNDAIILAGNFNEPLTLKTFTTAKICQNINLVDVDLRNVPQPSHTLHIWECHCCSRFPSAVTKYITAKQDHLTANNFFNNLATLIESPELDSLSAEKLDGLLVQAAVHAGKQCRARQCNWWSQILTIQRTKANLLRRLLSGYKNGVEVRPALNTQIQQLQLTFDLPPTHELCNAALCAT